MEKRRRRQKRKTTIKKFTPKMQAKLLLVFCVLIIALLFIIGRLVHINSSDGDKYAKRVLAQQTYTSSVVPYKRGTIYDSKGTVLAFSDKAYNLILDVKFMLSGEDNDFLEATMAALLDSFDFLSKDQLTTIVEERPNDQYVILAKELTYDEITKFEEYKEKEEGKNKRGGSKIKGVWFEEIFIRKYPNNSLASSLVGFTTNDGNGNWGLEQYYNEELNGTNGISYGYMDNELNLKSKIHPPVNGNSLVSTIDGNVQRIVQDHISKFNEEYGSKNLGVLVMNPNNGEIIAMASNEEYDLNNPADLRPFLEEEQINVMSEEEKLDYLNGIWRNFVISDAFEPGSTFKPFTMATGLEEGTLGENQTFYCGEEVGGWYIGCHKREGHGIITLTEALMYSCNDALMQMANSQGRELFHEYHTFFSFGGKTGIDIPGEAAGLIVSEENLNASELATSSFGQTFTTTMLQMVTGYSSLINGGNYYRPHFVKQILNYDGDVVKNIEAEILKKTVSRKTSEFLNNALYLTVEDGLAKTAGVPGYQVAGKTGTAQKQPRSAQTYVVSFLGHVPAYEPEVVIYVVVDEAQNVTRQANSVIATTIASEILADILPFLNIFPDEALLAEENAEAGDTNTSPNVDNQDGENQDSEDETPQTNETNVNNEESNESGENTSNPNNESPDGQESNGETGTDVQGGEEYNPNSIPITDETPGDT